MMAWNLDPVLLAGLAICAFLALRPASPRPAIAGVAVLAVAFVSPLCAISVALFMARAVHHILIVAIAAPLFALALPSRTTGMTGPAFVTAAGILWIWHLPSLYDAALLDTRIYWLMQASLLGSAIWFWRSLFAAPLVSATLGAIAAMAQMGMLGALLTFAPAPLYAAHVGTTLAWDLPQLVDQQLAGLIMWVPGIIPYAIALALIVRRGWARAGVTA
ncbi:cytochrome c oxidase assembly protein [Sphingobium sp.]|uniref:cytochrome c oxidase assembly protein n=1 Tax=Sphingobium sp. TaxID=1912891 RepID=UPI003BB753E8